MMAVKKKVGRPPKKKVIEKRPEGRPTKYKEEYAEQARKLCLLGHTDDDLADFFCVRQSTISNWKNKHPEFLESLKAGKELADSEIVDSLYNRARGYSHKDTHIAVSMGQVIETPTIKHYPPDATSMIFWLKNRQPAKWRDQKNIAHEGSEEKPIEVKGMLDPKQIAEQIKDVLSASE